MQLRTRHRTHRDQRGQAAIFMTMSLLAMLGLMGLVVDIGWAYWRKEAAYTAAQAASMAAVMAVSSASLSTCNANGVTCQNATACPASPTTPPSSNMMNGCLYAKQNGFVNSGRQLVTMEAHGPDGIAPPVTGLNPRYWVSATVTETIPQLFSAILGQNTATVRQSAVAAVFTAGSGACIYALDNTSATGLDVSGNPDVEATCGIYVNSTGSSAMDVGGSSAVVNSSIIKIVGNYSMHGHPTINPTPLTGQSATSDPFASVAAVSAPAGHGCDSSSGLPNSPVMPADGYYVVCSGGFSMSGGPTVTLPSGIYIFQSGSIDLHNGTLTGSNVTFYLTGTFSGITINGNVDVTLSAPNSGPTRGLLFYQDRSLALGAFNTKINGGSNQHYNGSLYFPTTNVTYSGGSDTSTSYTALVAWDIAFQGNSYFAADINGGHTGLGVPTISWIQ